jgi:phage shock protein A
MGLLERVSTLIRANLNDMVDRAEDPEKMIKQVIRTWRTNTFKSRRR